MSNALTIERLSKIYAGGTHALNDISLTVKEGDFFALLGPNGAGKSTTIGIVSSLVNKTSGRVNIFDHDLDIDVMEAKSCIGLVPQEFNVNVLTKIMENVMNHAGYYGVPYAQAYASAQKYLTQLGLWEKRDHLVRTLSGGMKRRLMIARALVHEPKLLLLDEPTAGVDIEYRRGLWDFLREINENGTTIILTTHYLEEAELLCRHIAIINKGNIIEHDSTRALLRKLHKETFVLYLDEPVFMPPSFVRQIDEHTLEVDLQGQEKLSDIIDQLSAHNIKIKTLRNKSNRLEELFLKLTQEG